jgi:hypothetical protein
MWQPSQMSGSRVRPLLVASLMVQPNAYVGGGILSLHSGGRGSGYWLNHNLGYCKEAHSGILNWWKFDWRIK